MVFDRSAYSRAATPLRPLSILVVILATVAASVGLVSVRPASAESPVVHLTRLANSVAPAVANGQLQPAPTPASAATQLLTLTLTLRRNDQTGFNRYLAAVENPTSPQYRHYLTQAQLASRFGPSPAEYERVVDWLVSQGFTLEEGSANRLTLSVRADRAQVERTLGTTIQSYRVGSGIRYANDRDPRIPGEIARSVQAISGLSNIAEPSAPSPMTVTGTDHPCPGPVPASPMAEVSGNPDTSVGRLLSSLANGQRSTNARLLYTPPPSFGIGLILFFIGLTFLAYYGGYEAASSSHFVNWYCNTLDASSRQQANAVSDAIKNAAKNCNNPSNNWWQKILNCAASTLTSARRDNNSVDQLLSTTPSLMPEKIGLLEFDTFHTSDVADFLNLASMPSLLTQLSEVPVNGGVASPGAGESEVLLDIEALMSLDPAGNTSYVVYDAPPTTSFQQMFNAMIDDGDTVISNSWAQCEDETSLADAQSIDSVLAQAAASGISVFNGTGDQGSSCLDGSPDTISVPADSPHATAVGGTTEVFNSPSQALYGGEAWWGSSSETPPSGASGYGVSKFFPRPAYQNGLNSSAMRSVPDVVAPADPSTGYPVCQADAGGCPDGLLYGGTSLAAPEVAAETALLDQMLGRNIGELNTAVYPLANTDSFHSPASMAGPDNDFSHVGLGSLNLPGLIEQLSSSSVGAVSPTSSVASGSGQVQADGTSPGAVVISLSDATGFPVSGKAVTLTPNAGSSAIVSAASGPSDSTTGSVSFTVTDTVPETVTFTVIDTTDDITLSTHPTIQFIPPVATSGSIVANPSTVADDGTSSATITVTLHNAESQGAEGKTITLSDGSADAQITPTGTTPGVTDSTGTATFTATDTQAETVTFTATDVTDGNLPVPGSADVAFSGDTSSSCNSGTPTGENGATVSTFAAGFPTGAEGLNSCNGAFGLAFDSSDDLFATDQFNGNLYRFPPGGGAADPQTLLSNALDPGVYDLTFGTDGELYGVMPDGTDYTNVFCTTCGAVVQIDPETGAIVRTVATGLDTPTWIATDPLSGDLFVSPSGSGSLFSPDLWRIQNPSSANPTLSVYGTDSNGFLQLAFAPNGTLYALTRDNRLVNFGGTNTAQPATETTVATLPAGFAALALGPIGANGTPSSVFLGGGGTISQFALPSGPVTQLVTGLGADPWMKAGPDGCLYAGDNTAVVKVTNSSGGCDLTSATGAPQIVLSGSGVTSPAAGSPVTFTANLSNLTSPAGTPILFSVTGANSQVKLVDASGSGSATFTYSAFHPGMDTVVATTTAASSTLTSNSISFTWGTGKDTSFVTLNGSQEIGPVGQAATLTASLDDVSQNPPTPVGSASIAVTAGDQDCTITTDSAGTGSCQITPTAGGLVQVTASYAGSSTLTSSSASNSFFAGGPSTVPSGPPPTTPEASDVILLPAAGVTLFGFIVWYRRRRGRRRMRPI